MKKILILILLFLVVANGSSAATSSGSVKIDGQIEQPVIPPVVSREFEITPVLGNVAPNCNQITITWKTQYKITYKDGLSGAVTKTEIVDANASTEVGYGIATDSENIVTGNTEINHSVTLRNLVSRKSYKYYIKSSDGVLTQKNAGGTFNVVCDISNPSIEVSAKDKGADIKINYPQGVDVARLVVRRSTVSAPTSMTAGTGIYDGEQLDLYHDASITLGTKYWYSVFICNGFNVCSEGTFGSAQRQVYPVTSFASASGEGKITLSWNNPSNNAASDFNFENARLIKVGSNCQSAGVNDGQLLVQGKVEGYEDTNVVNNTTYYYKIFAKNSYNEYSAGVCVSGTPSVEAEAKCISDINVMSGNNWVSLSWINPESSASFSFNSVQWQRNSVCVNSSNSGQMVYSGTAQNFYDNGVINDTVYTYSAFVNYGQSKVVDCGCVAAMPKNEDETEDINDKDVSGIKGGIKQGPNADYGFYVGGGALKISYPDVKQIYILPGYSMTISIPKSSMPKPVSLIVAQVGNKNYLISFDSAQNKYQTTFMVPVTPGDYNVQITTLYFDQTGSSQTWQLKVLPWCYASLDRKGVEKVSGAKVVLKNANGQYNGFGVTNPQITDESGSFGYMVPNGLYDVEITKEGLRLYALNNLKVENNVINIHADMAKDQNMLQAAVDIFNNPQRIAGNISDAIQQNIIQNKEVKTATVSYVAPSVVTVTSVSAAIAIPWWSLLHYLQYLFTEPFAWLLRRKKRGWGVVYNSITKEPIDLAVVRLYDKKTDKIVKSKITDRDGRYNFFVDEGEYYMEVSKPKFDFPSAILRDATEDKKYLDLYHGQTIEVKGDQEGVIVANIPLDQEDVRITDRQVLSQHFWQGIRKNINSVGPIFSIITLVVFPGILTITFTVAHLIMYLLFRRLAEHKKAKSWGVVYDGGTKQLLNKAVVRIFSPEYNKMLEVQITDRHGRYGFLAESNEYYITGAKEGYQDYKSSTIDLRNKDQSDIVGQDIALDQARAGVVAPSERIATAPQPLPNQLAKPTPEILAAPMPEAKPASIVASAPSETMPIENLPTQEVAPKETSSMEEIAERLRQEAEQKSQATHGFTDGFDASLMDNSITPPAGEGDEDEFYFDKLKQKTESPLDNIAKEMEASPAPVPAVELTPPAEEHLVISGTDDDKMLSMEEQLLLGEVEKKFAAYKAKHPTPEVVEPIASSEASDISVDSVEEQAENVYTPDNYDTNDENENKSGIMKEDKFG